jgi:uncharacterized damage-inducible protein DinB
MNDLFEHMAWADARVITRLTELGDAAPADAMRLLAHLTAAERVWLLRLRGEDASAQAIWPDWGIDEIRAVATENAAAYRLLLHTLDAAGAARIVEYRNSQGVGFRSAVRDILSQVALHGSYHRGQIAWLLRAGGHPPVSTDYIVFARERESAAG